MYLRSSGVIPAIVNKSAITEPLTLRSVGLSVLSEGDRFTYNSQGLKLESIKTSNPNTWKQLFV